MGKLYNLARMTTATVGTGTITLGSAVSGYLTFALAGVANADVVSYGIKDGANSEVGTGTYTTAGTTLTRTVTKSTNANAAISLSGTAEVFITPRAEDLLQVAGLLFGLTLSTAGASATFGIAAGRAVDSTVIDLMILASAYTKTTAAWAVGTGNGSFDGTGAAPTATAGSYHVHLIKRPDTGVVDILTSNSATAPTLPTNYTLFRRIGSMKTNGSFQWIAFIQDGDLFQWVGGAVADVLATNPGTAAVTRTLSVPTGINVIAQLQVGFSTSVLTSNPAGILISDLAVSDIAASTANATALNYASSGTAANYYTAAQCRTNTSAQVRSRMQISDANIQININTVGWVDRRGRDA